MSDLCTEERFLNDVKDHTMKVIKDEGVYRHLSFSHNGSSVYRFDLHTWPNELCITGDCGTYVFRRLEDMFQFFRTDDNDFNKNRQGGLSINPGYWGEKLISIGTNAGYQDFSEEMFIACVDSDIESYFEDADEELKSSCREAVLEDLESCEHETEYYTAIFNFKDERFPRLFTDFWEHKARAYTFHYLWCLYAIAWGVEKYDELKPSNSRELKLEK